MLPEIKVMFEFGEFFQLLAEFVVLPPHALDCLRNQIFKADRILCGFSTALMGSHQNGNTTTRFVANQLDEVLFRGICEHGDILICLRHE